jgi:FkbM family methyltransferase
MTVRSETHFDRGGVEADAIETVTGRYGLISVFSSDQVIGRSLQIYGEWAENEIAFLKEFIRTGDTVLDIGANIGTHTLAFAQTVKQQGRVYAFEPRPEIFRLLEAVVIDNALANVTLRQAAIGATEGVLSVPSLHTEDSANFGALSLVEAMAHAGESAPSEARDIHAVPMTTIDALGLTSCRLIKIDVEGAEAAVLEGARVTIERLHPILYAECNSVETALTVKRFYDSIGYCASMHLADAFNVKNFFGAPENMFGDAREAALLGHHPDDASNADVAEAEGVLLLPVDNADAITFALLQKPQFFHESLEPSSAGKRYHEATGRRGYPQDRIEKSEQRAAISEERAAMSEKRAEERAAISEERAAMSEKRAEERAAISEQRAARSEQRAARSEQRAAMSEQRAARSEKRAEERAAISEQRAARSEQRAAVSEKRAEERAAISEQRAAAANVERDRIDAERRRALDALASSQARKNEMRRTVSVLEAEIRRRDNRSFRRRLSRALSGSRHRPAHYLEMDAVRASELFDPAFYLERNPDVVASGMDPAEHYVKFGAREERDPGPVFSTSAYLRANPDVRASQHSALGHYELLGRQERRDLTDQLSPRTEAVAPTSDPYLLETEAVRASELFDPAFYLERNSDVVASGMDPAEHYVKFGAREERDPSPVFSTSAYLRANPDVRASQHSALGHYELYGRQERRDLADQLSPRTEAVAPTSDPYLTRHPDLEGEDHPSLDISISVIIPTHNAGPEFALLLRKLKSQKGLKSLEIVTVDSESRDGTARIAADFGCKVVPIKQSEFSHSHSRNLGAATASGDYLVFMVQDAYPIGDRWLYGLVRCLIDNRHGSGLAALSCAEYPRSDSELFYDVLLKGHYDFIGCSDGDRLGEYVADDHVSLRTQGQLSDVACLIPKALFDAYKYHGDYAEDLTLGVRLIRDGYRVGMLSSIRVIHSHNRPVQYYLRRSFVDVVFLTDIFSDFIPPAANDLEGTLAAAIMLSKLTPDLTSDPLRSPLEALDTLADQVRHTVLLDVVDERWDAFGFAPLQPWLGRLYDQPRRTAALTLSKRYILGFEQTRAMYADRLAALKPELSAYPAQDEMVCRELADAILKTLAMTIGSQLAFCCLAPGQDQHVEGMQEQLNELRKILTAGV